MARHRTTIEEWELYIPKVDDERELFASGDPEAITMEVKFLSKRRAEHYQRLARKMEKGPEHRKRWNTELRKMLVDHVRNITNVTVDDGAVVSNGGDLYDSKEEDLKTDVARALHEVGHLSEGLGKKLSTPSATSFSRQTNNADGGAQDATPQLKKESRETPTQTIPNSGSMTQRSDTAEIATENQERRLA